MFIKIWHENEVLGDQYNQFLDAEVEGVTMDECIENRIAEITYSIARLQEERAKLEDASQFGEKHILVDVFVSKYDSDPTGTKEDEVSVFVDEVDIFGDDISSDTVNELRKRHVDEWFIDDNGNVRVTTVEHTLRLNSLRSEFK